MIAVCTGRFRLSKRQTQELLSDFLGVELALGSVSNIEREVSLALAPVVEEARAYLRAQPVVNADETGWREAKVHAWLWTASTPLMTVFQIARSRGAAVAKQMLGELFSGFLVVDRWAGYERVECRQLCWSQLLRDFQGFVDRGGIGGPLGAERLEQSHRMFHLWHRVRERTLTRADFQLEMVPIEQRTLALLGDAIARAEPRTAGMAREILERREYLWSFVDNDRIQPTNNAAERAIRPAVIWRKGSFGTDSEDGSRFAEQILSVVTTLKQQHRNVLDYVVAACTALAANLPALSLLPVNS